MAADFIECLKASA